jgi:putative transposase
MKHAWIDDQRPFFRLRLMCKVLKVSRSGYYKHLRCSISLRAQREAAFVKVMQTLVQLHCYRYGSPRIAILLRRQGIPCSTNRVARLMANYGLGARRKKRYRITTQRDRTALASPNQLAQCFHVRIINNTWLTDITYIDTAEGWLFLTVVLDLASRRVVGWALLPTLEQHGPVQALRQALGRRRPSPGLIVHSDRGSQFTSHAFRALLHEHRISQSMSGTGNCYDNAPMESFFGTLKRELIHHRKYQTRDEARLSIIDYIELYYNAKRIHSSIGYQTPIEWERQQATTTKQG